MSTEAFNQSTTWDTASAVQLPYIPTDGVLSVDICGYAMEIRTTGEDMVSLEIPYDEFTDEDTVVTDQEWYTSYGGENYHPVAEYHLTAGKILCNHLEVPEPLQGNGIGRSALSLMPEIADVYPGQIGGFTIRFGKGKKYCSWLKHIGFPEEYVQIAPSRVSSEPSATVGNARATTNGPLDEPDVSLTSIGFEHFPDLV